MQRTSNWDDLRVVHAVATRRTLSGAAQVLGVTHSTVFRRLGSIEAEMGVRLFERYRDGYTPTPAGETAAAAAALFADQMASLEMQLSGQDLRPSGTVRIATTDTLGAIIMPHLVELRRQLPEIRLEFAISNAMANLTRREADVAVRPTPAPLEYLVGRRVADIAHAVYGSDQYFARRGGWSASVHEWIGLDEVLNETAIGRWMRAHVPQDHVAFRVDALPALRDAACVGIGLAVLPCYIGDTAPGLRRAKQKGLPDLHSALWLLTHQDLRRTARVRSVMDFLAVALASERELFEGKRQVSRLLKASSDSQKVKKISKKLPR